MELQPAHMQYTLHVVSLKTLGGVLCVYCLLQIFLEVFTSYDHSLYLLLINHLYGLFVVVVVFEI